jgi:hypothetical protein
VGIQDRDGDEDSNLYVCTTGSGLVLDIGEKETTKRAKEENG